MSEKLYVFVDETGTPSFSKKNNFFGLQGVCITEKEYKKLCQQWLELKLEYFHNDLVMLHSRDINQKKGPFKIFYREALLKTFVSDVHEVWSRTNFAPILIGIDIQKYHQKYAKKHLVNPYSLALGFLLERLGQNYTNYHISIKFESRGKKEDETSEYELNKLINGPKQSKWILGNEEISIDIEGSQFWVDRRLVNQAIFSEPKFFSKKEKIAGLEIADFMGFNLSQHFKSKSSAGLAVIKKKLISKNDLYIFPK